MNGMYLYIKRPPTGAEVMKALSAIQTQSRKHRRPGKPLKQAYMETLWEGWQNEDSETVCNCVTVMESHLKESKVTAPARVLIYQPARLN